MSISVAEWGLGVVVEKTEGNRFILDGTAQDFKDIQVCNALHPRDVSYRRYRRGKNRCRFCGGIKCPSESPNLGKVAEESQPLPA